MFAMYNWILEFLKDNNKPPSSFVGTYEDVFVPQRFDYDCVSGKNHCSTSLSLMKYSIEQSSAEQNSAEQT